MAKELAKKTDQKSGQISCQYIKVVYDFLWHFRATVLVFINLINKRLFCFGERWLENTQSKTKEAKIFVVGILPSSGDDGVVPGWVGVGSGASAEAAV